MKVGFLVECGPNGADEQVLRHLVTTLRGNLEARFTTCDNKRFLLEKCGALVAKLFDEEHCTKVFVVWDLVPCDANHHQKGKPSCVKEREHLLAQLRPKDKARTVLLCITHELEAWLLADGNALEELLRNRNHPSGNIADDKKPERHPNPKKQLGKVLQEYGRLEYVDRVHAVKIIKNAKVSKLQRVPSFARFKQKLDEP